MFLIKTTNDGHVPPFIYLPCGDFTPKLGMALKMTGGSLALASGTDMPPYICMTEGKENMKDKQIPVIEVTPDIVFSVITSSAVTRGDSVTISADGLSVTATKGGAAYIVNTEEADGGTEASIRFLK